MKRSSLGALARLGAKTSVISLSTLYVFPALVAASMIALPSASAIPFASGADCLEKNLAAHIYMSAELTEQPLNVPFSDPRTLKQFYGLMLIECHAERLLEGDGVERTVAEEIQYRNSNSSKNRVLQTAVSEYGFDGDIERVFSDSSHCVPAEVRQQCLGTLVSE